MVLLRSSPLHVRFAMDLAGCFCGGSCLACVLGVGSFFGGLTVYSAVSWNRERTMFAATDGDNVDNNDKTAIKTTVPVWFITSLLASPSLPNNILAHESNVNQSSSKRSSLLSRSLHSDGRHSCWTSIRRGYCTMCLSGMMCLRRTFRVRPLFLSPGYFSASC